MYLQEWSGNLVRKLLKLGPKEWGMLLLAGVCCLIIVFPAKEKETAVEPNEIETGQSQVKKETESDYVSVLEERLTELLSCVKDVGNVKVMITVAGSTEKEILQDGTMQREESTEQDSAGGSRHSVSTKSDGTTVFAESNGKSMPYVLSESYPEVTGVVVIAEGSGKGTVDLDILNAVQVLFHVPAHKIKIMKMK